MEPEANYDVVFVVALEEEANILVRTLNGHRSAEITLGIYSFSELRVDFNEFWSSVKLGLLCLKDQGPEAASSGTSALLAHTSVRLLVSIGISGRIEKHCELGDVVVAKSTHNYSYRLRVGSAGLDPAGKTTETTNIGDTMNRAGMVDFLEGFGPLMNPAGRTALSVSGLIGKYPRLHFGNIASGPYLVDSREFQNFLKQRNRLFFAVDMESHAVLEAAASVKFNGATMVIRGISDYADGTKNQIDDKYKGRIRAVSMQAASAAFRFLYEDRFDVVNDTLRGRSQFLYPKPIVDRAIALIEAVERHINHRPINEAVVNPIERPAGDDPLVSIAQLSEFAFRSMLNQLDDIPQQLHTRLVESSPQTLDFLIAKFVIESIKSCSTGERLRSVEALENVYAAGVNRYCKALMNMELSSNPRRFFDCLRFAYSLHRKAVEHLNHKEMSRRIQVAYLVGRIDVEQFRQEAITTLRQWRDNLLQARPTIKNGEKGKQTTARREQSARKRRHNTGGVIVPAESDDLRLLLRTIQISLVQLGGSDASKDYILQCMRNEKYDRQNRGFHLEYYGDISVVPGERLNSVDDPSIEFSRTFGILFEAVRSATSRSGRDSMHDIRLYTLLSLAHHRHLKGKLPNSNRLKLLELLKTVAWKDSSPDLDGYLLLIREHLAEENIRASFTLKKLFLLKKLARSGWNDRAKGRHVALPETVAAHTFGAMTLGYMLLPETNQRRQFGFPSDYSKEKVLKYLLVHDFAEAWIGDLLPKEKNETTAILEEEAFRRLAANYTYGGYNGCNLYSDWHEFETGNSINAVIARDLDQLDSLLQLEIERGEISASIPDYDDWLTGISRRLSWWGHRVFDFIRVGDYLSAPRPSPGEGD